MSGRMKPQWASFNGRVEMVRFLLDAGVDKHARDEDDDIPSVLYFASCSGFGAWVVLAVGRAGTRESRR